MKQEHVQYLACPECRSALTLEASPSASQGEVMEGAVVCTRCQARYPVSRGVPRFVPMDNYAEGFGLQWNRHAKTQLDSYTGVPLSETRFFRATGWPRRMEGKVILEVGSGAGRFTEQAASTGAMVVSLDYSHAVEANFSSNGHKDNVLVVQGDAYKMPVFENAFDRVFCLGVLQHTPDVHRTFRELPKYLKPGGRLAVDVYCRFPWWKQWTITKYWARPFSRRLKPQTLYRWVNGYIHLMWPLARFIGRLPKGRNWNWKLLIADYRGMYPLSEELLKDWAVLDTFDMLAPAFDQPQTLATLRSWFEEAGLEELEFGYDCNGFEGRGRRPVEAGTAMNALETVESPQRMPYATVVRAASDPQTNRVNRSVGICRLRLAR